MALIDSAYDYYVSNYVNKEVSRYDSHKQDDLRRISSRIVSANKDSPLYKIINPESAKRYAIDIKEHARTLLNVVDSLADSYGSFEDSFQKKVAISSDEDKIGVTYIGDGTEEDLSESYRIEIQRLAEPQVNTGSYLPDNECSIPPGSYSFDLDTTTSSYEFQYNVSPDETNLAVITKLARVVNSADLGITAKILDDRAGSSALSFTSVQTGLQDDEESLFAIFSDGSSGSIEAMDILGIDRISQPAHNSSFLVNGSKRESPTNTFTVNNEFELKLRKTTDSEGVTIGFKPNTDAIADNIQTLVDAYNATLQTAVSKSDSNETTALSHNKNIRRANRRSIVADDSPRPAGSRLYRDMATLSRDQKLALEKVGLIVHDDASISIDREILSASVTPECANDTFETLSAFRDSIGEKAQSISVNPMHYVSRIIVAYKNPGHNFATPYISSLYSGMLLDQYV
jgi:flagellar hook-associated protein 2